MVKLTNQERLKPWMGVVFFGILMLLFVTVCAFMQMTWGIYGLIGTELLFAGASILYCKIRNVSIKEVFPVKKISLREFFGCIILLIATYMFSILSIILMQMIFPSSASEAEGISDMLYTQGYSYFFLVLAVAILPAICEEMAHRGAILSSFRGVKHEWIAIVAVGLSFSINHLSILRGPFTFIMGAILAWIVIKRNNILLTMMMHGMLNAFSVTLTYIMSKVTDINAAAQSSVAFSSTSTIASILTVTFAAPVLLVTGMMLVNPQTHKAKRFIFAGIASGIMFIAGMGISVVNMSQGSLLQSTISYEFTEDTPDQVLDFTIEDDGTYLIQVVMTNATGNYHITVQDTEGNVACQGDISQGAIRIYQETIAPEPDDYQIIISGEDGSLGEHPTIVVNVQGS